MEKLLTVKALAIILDRSEGAIRNDLSRNPERLPCPLALPGRFVRFHPSDVLAWLDGIERKEKKVVTALKRRRGRPTKAEQIKQSQRR